MDERVAADAYPATLLEFEDRFGTEEECREYLFRLRWPDRFRCPRRCGSTRAWPRKAGGLWECSSCGYKASVTAGTIFDRTRIPLRVWFRAAWLVTSQKGGVSALGLQRMLGLTRYETVWTLLHKLRRAMVRPGRDRLAGAVEVDETYVGGEKQGVRGRGSVTKTLVAIAAEEDGKGIGRVRLEAIPDASADSLLSFVDRSVLPGSLVRTDAWDSYDGIKKRGYAHESINIRRSGVPAHDLLPRGHASPPRRP